MPEPCRAPPTTWRDAGRRRRPRRHRSRAARRRSCSARVWARPSVEDLERRRPSRSIDLPGFPPPGVPGHAGRLVLGPPRRRPVGGVLRPGALLRGARHGRARPAAAARAGPGRRHDGAHGRGGRRSCPDLRGRHRGGAADHLNHDGDRADARLALPRRDAGVRSDAGGLRSRASASSRSRGPRRWRIRGASRDLRRDERPRLRDAGRGGVPAQAPARPWWGCRWCPRRAGARAGAARAGIVLGDERAR